MLKINYSTYFKNKTAFLSKEPVKQFVHFSDFGFTVTAPKIAFSLVRQSKNNYIISIMWHGQCFKYSYDSLEKALEVCKKICDKHFSEAV